jgi:hypothetical protein
MPVLEGHGNHAVCFIRSALGRGERLEAPGLRISTHRFDVAFYLAMEACFQLIMRWKLLLLIGLLGCTVAARAQGTFTFTPSSMGPIIPGNWPYTTDTQSFTFPTPAISLANYNSLQATFSAPSGYAWQVTPSLLAGWAFNCVASYQLLGDPMDYHQTADYSFNFVPGMANTVSGGVTSQRLSEQSFGFAAAFQFGGNVEFTGLTVTLHYATQHDWQVAQRPLSQFSEAYMKLTYYGVPDPSQHLLLVPTPEPSVAALAVLGAALAMIATSGLRFRHRPKV